MKKIQVVMTTGWMAEDEAVDGKRYAMYLGEIRWGSWGKSGGVVGRGQVGSLGEMAVG